MTKLLLQARREEWSRRHTPERLRRFLKGELSAADRALLHEIVHLMDEDAPQATRDAAA